MITSMRPCVSTAWSTSVLTCCALGHVRLRPRASAAEPELFRQRLKRSMPARARDQLRTVARKATRVASPRPLLAPVMTTTLPSMLSSDHLRGSCFREMAQRPTRACRCGGIAVALHRDLGEGGFDLARDRRASARRPRRRCFPPGGAAWWCRGSARSRASAPAARPARSAPASRLLLRRDLPEQHRPGPDWPCRASGVKRGTMLRKSVLVESACSR